MKINGKGAGRHSHVGNRGSNPLGTTIYLNHPILSVMDSLPITSPQITIYN